MSQKDIDCGRNLQYNKEKEGKEKEIITHFTKSDRPNGFCRQSTFSQIVLHTDGCSSDVLLPVVFPGVYRVNKWD